VVGFVLCSGLPGVSWWLWRCGLYYVGVAGWLVVWACDWTLLLGLGLYILDVPASQCGRVVWALLVYPGFN
jgi:hypothetical protein